MKCSDAKPRMAAFMDGRIGGEEAQRLREHLASCSACAKSLDPVEHIEYLPIMDGEIEPSADLPDRFRVRLREHRNKDLESEARWWTMIWRPRPLLALGAFIAVFIVILYMGTDWRADTVPEEEAGGIAIAENLSLLQEMEIIRNLDLLENFDVIKDMNGSINAPSEIH